MTTFTKTLLFTVLCLIYTSCSVHPYQSPDIQSQLPNNATVAILPPIITYRTPKLGFATPPEIKEKQIWDESIALQTSIFNKLLKLKTSKNPVTVNFQDTNRTNSILQQNNIGQEELNTFTPEKLAKLLSVDAVFYTRIEKDMLVDDFTLPIYQLGKAILNNGKPSSASNGVKIGTLHMNSTLNNGKNGNLLSKFWSEYDITADTNIEDYMVMYGNQCAKNFPRAK